MKKIGENYLRWLVEPSEAGKRLDEFIADKVSLSLEKAQDFIYFGSVQVNNKREKDPSRTLISKDIVLLYIPFEGVKPFYEINPNRIVYRDQWIIAYDKEPSIPSHQVPSEDYNNVLEALRRFLRKETGTEKPYLAIQNRLDKEASGVLLFTLDPKVNKSISKSFALRKVKKLYLLWAHGEPLNTEWLCKKPITKEGGLYKVSDKEGKEAETYFKVLYSLKDKHLILAMPKTGRTHQIRLHVLASNLRLYGDRQYGGPSASRLMLHGWKLALSHPISRKFITIEAPIPEEILKMASSPEELLKVVASADRKILNEPI